MIHFVLASLLAVVPIAALDAGDVSVTGKLIPALAPFDELFTSFVAAHDVAGVAVAVARNGKLVYARGFGFSDRDKKTPVKPTDLFRIASVSKPITAVAVLQLVEQGKLALDDHPFAMLGIEPFLEDGAKPDPRLQQITVLQLLQHIGGFDRDRSGDPMFRSVEYANELGIAPPAGPRDVIRMMAGRPLDSDPGTKYAYSNFGYCVLGRVIEKVSGQPYAAYVKEHVLAPVGVTRMRIGATLIAGRAEDEVLYYPRNPAPAASVFPDPSGKIGTSVSEAYGAWNLEAMDSHGGWIASAPDLLRFACALDDDAKRPLLKASSVATLFSAPKLAGVDPDVWYGCGWSVRKAGKGKLNTWHTGLLAGTATLLVRRYDGLAWAVLFNSDSAKTGEYLGGLVDGAMHGAADKVKQWPQNDLFETDLK